MHSIHHERWNEDHAYLLLKSFIVNNQSMPHPSPAALPPGRLAPAVQQATAAGGAAAAAPAPVAAAHAAAAAPQGLPGRLHGTYVGEGRGGCVYVYVWRYTGSTC